MLFKKEDLQELCWGDEINGLEVISTEIVDTGRWSIHHEMIFTSGGKFYRSHFSTGATESQDESPYEFDDDEIECQEVEPYEETIIKYKAVK